MRNGNSSSLGVKTGGIVLLTGGDAIVPAVIDVATLLELGTELGEELVGALGLHIEENQIGAKQLSILACHILSPVLLTYALSQNGQRDSLAK